MTVLIYALAAIALVAATWAARGLYRELRDDLRQDLAYAGRRFKGLRIVIRCGGQQVRSCEAGTHKPGAIHGDQVRTLTSAPPRSTNGHRLRLVTPDSQLPTPITTKGETHG